MTEKENAWKKTLKFLLSLFTWILKSRRPLHLAVGMAIATATTFLCVYLQCTDTATKVITLWTTLLCACAAEYKDHEHGGEFDPLDVLATELPAIIFIFL